MATVAPRVGGRGRIKPLDAILATAEKKSEAPKNNRMLARAITEAIGRPSQ